MPGGWLLSLADTTPNWEDTPPPFTFQRSARIHLLRPLGPRSHQGPDKRDKRKRPLAITCERRQPSQLEQGRRGAPDNRNARPVCMVRARQAPLPTPATRRPREWGINRGYSEERSSYLPVSGGEKPGRTWYQDLRIECLVPGSLTYTAFIQSE